MVKFTSLAVFTLLFGLCAAQPSPTEMPSPFPTLRPTKMPSDAPSMVPSDVPSDSPSKIPSDEPSMLPSLTPSDSPSMVPSDVPSDSPSQVPSDEPSMLPSMVPSDQPSQLPSKEPSRSPSSVPSDQPSQIPSKEPSRSPSSNPTSSIKPSPSPSHRPSGPTTSPTATPKTPTSAPVATCDDTDGFLFAQKIFGGGNTYSCEWVCQTKNADKFNFRKSTYCDADPEIASNCCFSCSLGLGCDGNIAPTPTAPTPTAPTPTAPTPTSSCVDDSTHTFTAPFNLNNPDQNCAYIAKKICNRGAKYCDPGSEKFISNQREGCCATCALYDDECNSSCSDDAGTPITLKFDGSTTRPCSWLTVNDNKKAKRQANYCLNDGSKYDVANSCCASCNA